MRWCATRLPHDGGRQRGCTALDEAPAPPTSNPIRHALHLRRDHCSAHPRRPRSTCRLCRACTCARSPTPTQQSIGKNTQGVERMVLHVHHVDMPQMRRCATRLLNDGDQQRVAHEQLFHVDTRRHTPQATKLHVLLQVRIVQQDAVHVRERRRARRRHVGCECQPAVERRRGARQRQRRRREAGRLLSPNCEAAASQFGDFGRYACKFKSSQVKSSQARGRWSPQKCSLLSPAIW